MLVLDEEHKKDDCNPLYWKNTVIAVCIPAEKILLTSCSSNTPVRGNLFKIQENTFDSFHWQQLEDFSSNPIL